LVEQYISASARAVTDSASVLSIIAMDMTTEALSIT
jgi:hypothetical protein